MNITTATDTVTDTTVTDSVTDTTATTTTTIINKKYISIKGIIKDDQYKGFFGIQCRVALNNRYNDVELTFEEIKSTLLNFYIKKHYTKNLCRKDKSMTMVKIRKRIIESKIKVLAILNVKYY